MDTMKWIFASLVFAATIAVALNASSGDAYAKMKSDGGSAVLNDSDGITIAVGTPTSGFLILGVTWE